MSTHEKFRKSQFPYLHIDVRFVKFGKRVPRISLFAKVGVDTAGNGTSKDWKGFGKGMNLH